MSDLPEIKPQPALKLALVDPEIPPTEAPIEERRDATKTKEAFHTLAKQGVQPAMIRGITEAMGGTLVTPTAQDVAQIMAHRNAHGLRCCGNCAQFDHAGAQALLRDGGAKRLMENQTPEALAMLGTWERLGLCNEDGVYTVLDGPPCRAWAPKRKGVFGRIMSGVWRRVNDI